MLVTFDGIEGAGKSTQVLHFATRLRSGGRAVRSLRDPGGTPLGEELRHLLKRGTMNVSPKAELLMFAAARAQLIHEVILPALEAGEIVVCDRFYHSTVAYQGYGRGLMADVENAMAVAVGSLSPHITFVLDLTLEASHDRLKKRGEAKDRIEQEKDDFFNRVRDGFRSYWGQPGIVVLDASRPEAEVHEAVWKEWERRSQ